MAPPSPNYELTAASLATLLRRSGSLPSGDVMSVRVDSELETWISTLAFVSVEYTADAPTDLPRNLVVKTPLTGAGTESDAVGEVAFYRRLAPIAGTPPIPRCVAAAEATDHNPETIVLEDLRATHDHPRWPLPPSRVQCELALDALARVHSLWWEAPSLGGSVGAWHTAESLRTMVNGVSAHLPAFFDAVGGSLTREGRAVLEHVFSSSLKPWLRLTQPRALTVAHGDAHSWNFLFPRASEGAAFLIDWQLWHLDLGARDLAYLMALHWSPQRRRELEEHCLRYYHAAIQKHGVTSYDFDELFLDYRRGAVRNLTLPILFWSRGMKPKNWWHRLEYALASYSDLGCDDVL